jgi:PAS domain S-box-containing protein
VIIERPATPSVSAPESFGYRAVLEASPNAILAVDANSVITYANPLVATTFGYEQGELLGQPFDVLIPARARERHAEHRRRYMADPVARPIGIGMDVIGLRKDGSELPVEVSLWPVETPDGLLVFASVIDITARRDAVTRLLQGQKLESIGRLAGGIAHDFNNMLSAILGYAELLEQDLAPDRSEPLDADRALRSIHGINVAAERAATLTKQLLAFSRQQEVSPEVIEVNKAVRHIDPMLRRIIGENVRLVTHLDPGAGRLRADPGQLDQILVNLVVNARDAMPTGGTVTIETGNAVFEEAYAIEHFEVSAGPFVTLVVKDTGEGMDAETRQHVYEPYFTTKEPGKGTGLGLATIYGIVRQAGGHIALYSQPGRGTTFKVYLPRVDAAVS